MTSDLQACCDALVRSFRKKPDASARTVLVTVFGDGIELHGGEAWAGSLLRLVEPLGMNERLVRTSLNRLVGEGVLGTLRHGKRSFYSVTPLAVGSSARPSAASLTPVATPRTVVVKTSDVASPARAAVRQQLGRIGFAPLGPSVHISLFDQVDALGQVLADLGLINQLAVFRGQVPATVGLDVDNLGPTEAASSFGCSASRPATGAELAQPTIRVRLIRTLSVSLVGNGSEGA